MPMKSIKKMLLLISSMIGTSDITEWEENFIQSCLDRSDEGHNTEKITTKQCEIIEKIYNKHYG